MTHKPVDRDALPEPEVLAGAELKRLRTERGWSQEEVARRMSAAGFDWHQTSVGRTESAKRPLRVNEAVMLSAIFEVPVTQLLVPAAVRMSDVDEEIRVLEEARSEVTRMLDEFQPTLELAQTAIDQVAETHRKLSSAVEGMDTRLTLLREVRRILSSGHQLPPDVIAQLGGLRELLSIPGLSSALDAHKAQR